MRVRFDPTFDHGAWPDALDGAAAAVGRAIVGPLGLLDLLETALGLGGLNLSEAERNAALMPSLEARGFWSRSAATDPLGTAARLLRQRDELWMEGWSGEPVSRALEELARVTATAPAGMADRLAAVNSALARPFGARAAETITHIELLGPDDDLPLRWRTTLESLQAHGTTVERSELPPPPSAPSDLGQVQRILLEKGAGASRGVSGDGTIQLLRPGGVLEAAEATAAWLAAIRAQARGRSIVLVNSDPILDDALARHGVPTAGALAGATAAPLAVLPLAIALLWSPCDPARARELLQIPSGPLPRSVCLSLVSALDQWPAVGSPEWSKRLEKWLGGREDAGVVARPVEVLFGASLAHGLVCPPDRLWPVLDLLDDWCAEFRAADPVAAGGDGVWSQVSRQLGSFRLLAESALAFGPEPGWFAPELMRLARAATEDSRRSGGVGPRRPAQAGLHVVRDPGGVAGPADYVVWWNFTEEAEGRVSEIGLSEDERTGLAEIGVRPPDFGARAIARAARYARPLLSARTAILLVAPHTGPDGEESHPHPLWDECAVRLSPKDQLRLSPEIPRLPDSGSTGKPGQMALWAGGSPARHERPLTPAPWPRRAWNAPAEALGPREVESPSGLERLISCEFQWAVRHLGRVEAGLAKTSPSPNLVRGSVAHEILAEVLARRDGWSDAAGTEAELAGSAAASLFDREAYRLWAHLGMPGSEAEKTELRQAIVASAEWLAGCLVDGGYTEVETEKHMEGTLDGGRVGGRSDLVLGPRAAVIDLKLGGATGKRRLLEAGAAVQLAAYAWLASGGGVDLPDEGLPAVGYFILTATRLFTTDKGAFPRSTVLAGPPAADTWRAVTETARVRWRAFEEGVLEARGVTDGEGSIVEKSALAGALVALKAPCEYCDLGALCGRMYGEGDVEES